MRFKKGLSILLAVIFFATLMLSLTFIVENSHHDCTGHDCVVCQMLETAEEITGGKTEDSNVSGYTFNQFFTESQPIPVQNDGAAVSSPVLLHDLLTI